MAKKLKLINPRFVVFDNKYRVAIVNSLRRITDQEELPSALPRVVWEQANAVYSLDFKFWAKWRGDPDRMDPITKKVLSVLLEGAEKTLPVSKWTRQDPHLVWWGAWVNENTGFYCGYKPVTPSKEENEKINEPLLFAVKYGANKDVIYRKLYPAD